MKNPEKQATQVHKTRKNKIKTQYGMDITLHKLAIILYHSHSHCYKKKLKRKDKNELLIFHHEVKLCHFLCKYAFIPLLPVVINQLQMTSTYKLGLDEFLFQPMKAKIVQGVHVLFVRLIEMK